MNVFTQHVLDDLADKATASPRRRAHLNIHASPTEAVQRFFVVANRDSYFRPHRHLSRSELALIIRGQFEVVTFDEHGVVTARHVVGEGSTGFGYETPQAVWHTLLATADGGAFFEVKEGPYDPATSVEFAAWAPAEGDPAAKEFMQWLRSAQPGDTAPRP